ncbi:MarR family winged helix-turn-helix transcriptional regulator [Mycolicibacterium sp. CR10]|uniref:MarR family winged helix-turn-helix transcriptional regulator n=1 Tax=Mycolicibacterium sp. CR10 TaxID=2562314 RepID=UPI0010C13CAD|nr:MarR family transcriptional regulator [Mycolicibacterium sp. CR10]
MPDPVADPPLGYLLHRVATALRADVTASVLDPLELTFPQYICMRMLSHRPGRSNAELARDVMVSPQAMNMVVRGLQDRGLVTRPPEVSSGRSRPAELTREGEALLSRTMDGVHCAEQRVLGPLTEAQRRQFRHLLTELG